MGARSMVARTVTAVLGSAPVAAVSSRRWADPLRVVAYHTIPDRSAFAAQLDLIARDYHPVSEAQVRAASAGGAPLPERSVWITFDDGDPSVVAVGLDLLAGRGIPATVYVCPGLVDAGAAPWWRVVEAAGASGAGAEVDGASRAGTDLVRALKRVPDAQRRQVVASLAAAAEPHLGAGPRALTPADLDRWVDAGLEVGNHTWDHPCLDRCDPDEQRRQIADADAWLRAWRPDHDPSFAYPNGDHTDHAESVLVQLGYDTALLFDHALTSADASPLRTSRLRLDTEASVNRARAVLSGAHSALL